MSDEELFNFCYKMYEHFGQWSVINFVKDRQFNGQLQHIYWRDCDSCEYYSPFLDVNCLICGGIISRTKFQAIGSSS